MGLYIGTSGWAYKEWKPDFYPADLPQRRFLEHYSSVFHACEANATFYKVQPATTLQKWDELTPDGFRFVMKVHRGLSYMRQITPDEDRLVFLKDYLTSLQPLGVKVKALLFQVHPRRKADVADLEGFIAAIPEGTPPLAFDLGDDSWQSEDVRRLVADAGHTMVLSERAGEAPDRLPPGPIAYVRLRAQHYDPAAIQRWTALLEREGRARDVFAFAKHEGIETLDDSGGVGLARRLHESVTRADHA